MGGNGPLKAVLDKLDVTRRAEWLEDRGLCRAFAPGEVDVKLRFLEIVRELGL